MTDGIRFSTGELVDGKLIETNTRIIQRSDILACPQVILMAEHYREDGSCRCDEGEYDEEGTFVLFDQTGDSDGN